MSTKFEYKKASLTKRFVAFLIDFGVFAIFFIFSMFCFTTAVTDYDVQQQIYNQKCLEHNLMYLTVNEDGVEESVSWTIETYLESSYASTSCKVSKKEDIKEISNECRTEFNEFVEANNKRFEEDKVAIAAYSKFLEYRVIFYSVSAFMALFVVNLVFPLIFKDGRTLGKKILGTGLLTKKKDKVKLINVLSRFILGVFLIETIPYILNLAAANVYGLALFSGLAASVINFILIMFTEKQMMLHDYLGGTIVVDFSEESKLLKLGGKK